jgi:hypothetical protein
MADDSRSRPGSRSGSTGPGSTGPGSTGPGSADPDTARGGERGERAIAALGALVRRFGRWMVRFAGESARAWRYLDFEQRVAGVGALLLIVSTFGPFSFVEAAIGLVALAVLLLLKKRADGRKFHLPFGDGAVIMAAGAWSGLLIVIRLFDRSLGQNLLALVCAAILVLAGLRMRLKRPMDDLPQERERGARPGVDIAFAGPAEDEAPEERPGAASGQGPAPGDTAETQALPREREATEKPPEPRAERRTSVQRQTPAARRAPAVDPPTAVRPSEPPPAPPAERSDPDFDLPAPSEEPPSGPPARDESPFRARPADKPRRPPPER